MNAVGYARLSRDEDKENYSSIESQKDIINEYAFRNNIKISKMYVDDNYSGYSFNRPGFKEMWEELENGRIDLIIAKDLSRFGRHNAKVLLFIEDIKEMGKNLILVEEGANGYNVNEDDDDILGIKTWYNERYVKDISKKVRSGMHIKQKKGELVMGNLYGYIKDPNNKSTLYIDKNLQPVIELIFKLYLEGYGYKRICDVLDEKGFPTPSENIKTRHSESGRVFKNAVSGKWQTHSIQRIICNDLYIGTLRTHKKQNRRVKGKQERVPDDEQYVFPNHHAAIISTEDFELAKQIKKKRGEESYKGRAKYPYVFSSFVYCGDCGFTATGKNLGKRPLIKRGYECTQYTKYGLKGCVAHNMPEEKLLFFFKEFLKDIRQEYADYLEKLDFTRKRESMRADPGDLQKELNEVNEELKLLLNQKLKDILKETRNEFRIILERSYDSLEQEKKKRINELNNRINELQKVDREDTKNSLKTAIQIFDNIIQSERPSRKDLEMILDKILLYGKSQNFRIEFKLLLNIESLTYEK